LAYAAGIVCGWICLFVVLWLFEHIDPHARAEVEIEHLKKKRSLIMHYHHEVQKKYDKITKFTNLWECRTLPCLRIMKAFIEHVYDFPKDALNLLKAANDGFKSLEYALGPKPSWYSDDAPPYEKLTLVEQLLEAAKDTIVSIKDPDELVKYTKNIFHPFAVLTVRVNACHNLHPGSYFDKSDPYVRVRLASTGWQKTPTQKNNTDPKWESDNEFSFFPVHKDMALEIEVKDANVGRDSHLGDAEINFRDLPHDDWVVKRVELQGAKQGEVKFIERKITTKGIDQGEVSVSLYYSLGMKRFLENSDNVIDIHKEVEQRAASRLTAVEVAAMSEDKTCHVCSRRLGKRHLHRWHHCRICGNSVCSKCCQGRVKIDGNLERACKRCVSDAFPVGSRRSLEESATSTIHAVLNPVVGNVLKKGKEERGARGNDRYKFGDLTRGLFAAKSSKR